MEPKVILKKARVAKGYTQEMVADKVGISHRMYQRYEEGKFPKYKSVQIKKIDQLLGTNLQAALYGKAMAGKKNTGNDQVIRIKDKDLEQVIGEMHEDIISLKATATVLTGAVAELSAKETGKPVARITDELLKASEALAERLFSELRKKSG